MFSFFFKSVTRAPKTSPVATGPSVSMTFTRISANAETTSVEGTANDVSWGSFM